MPENVPQAGDHVEAKVHLRYIQILYPRSPELTPRWGRARHVRTWFQQNHLRDVRSASDAQGSLAVPCANVEQGRSSSRNSRCDQFFHPAQVCGPSLAEMRIVRSKPVVGGYRIKAFL